jgi:hypothetical protein
MNQDQKPLPVQSVKKAGAAGRITLARERFLERHGEYPSVIQVGEKLFTAAYGKRLFPNMLEVVGKTLVIPRRDLCGDWMLRIPKLPPEKQA